MCRLQNDMVEERPSTVECESCGSQITDGKWIEYEGSKLCYRCIDNLPRDM